MTFADDKPKSGQNSKEIRTSLRRKRTDELAMRALNRASQEWLKEQAAKQDSEITPTSSRDQKVDRLVRKALNEASRKWREEQAAIMLQVKRNSLRGRVMQQWKEAGTPAWSYDRTRQICLEADEELDQQSMNPAPCFRQAIRADNHTYVRQWVYGCHFPWLNPRQ